MARRPRAVREPATAYETTVDPNGRIVLPAAVRRQLGVAPGDEVVLRLEGDAVTVTSRAAAFREAQALVRKHLRKGASPLDDLLAWRREESRRG